MNSNIADYFDNMSFEWDEKYRKSKYFIFRYNEFKNLFIKYSKSNYITLDYGCGSGVITSLLKEYCNEVIATDISKNMLELTTRKFFMLGIMVPKL